MKNSPAGVPTWNPYGISHMESIWYFGRGDSVGPIWCNTMWYLHGEDHMYTIWYVNMGPTWTPYGIIPYGIIPCGIHVFPVAKIPYGFHAGITIWIPCGKYHMDSMWVIPYGFHVGNFLYNCQ